MRANSWRFYITPFLDSGAYGTEVEVTKDVVFSSLGSLQLAFDNSDFAIGILRNSSVSVTLNNREGVYSDVDAIESMFKHTRANSKFRITYSLEENPNYAGSMVAGQTWLCTEVDVFNGLIDDNSATMDLQNHLVALSVLGLESVFEAAPMPYASIANGDSIATTIFNLLNQTAITKYLTVLVGNINPGASQTIDDITPYQNGSTRNALSDLLLASSSVLYIRNSTVYVAARTPTADVKKTFYWQGAVLGIENVLSIDNIRSGFAKIFNYLTWRDAPTVLVSDSNSVTKYGVKLQEFEIGFFTNTTKMGVLLAAILAEFKDPKQEFVLTTAVNHSVLDLQFLDRVTVDYPLMVLPAGGQTLPICGQAICGVAYTPKRLSNFYLDPPTDFKIMNIEINLQQAIVKLKLRAI